jgi:uncharacterized membrane protein (DUF2068 family)
LAIAIFKLFKGVALTVVGIGALSLLHHDVGEVVSHWVDVFRVDPGNRFIHRLLVSALSVTPQQLEAASVGTFFYSGLLLTEGIGLLLRKTWAEYFTIISTAGLLPLEVYEINRHLTATRVVVLLINVAIVIYLVKQVRRKD